MAYVIKNFREGSRLQRRRVFLENVASLSGVIANSVSGVAPFKGKDMVNSRVSIDCNPVVQVFDGS